jgi:hypothetical protein
MRDGNLRALLMIAFAVPAFASSAAAQAEHPVTGYAEFAVTRRSFGGSGLERIKPGTGFDVAGVVTAQPPLFFAVGVQYSSHHTTDSDIDATLGALQLYVEPRFELIRTGKVLPYVFLRLGYVRMSQTATLIDDTGGSITGTALQTGPSIGGGGAVIYRVTPHVRAFVSGGFERISLGDIDFDYSHVAASKSKGSSVVITFGINLDFSLNSSSFKLTALR